MSHHLGMVCAAALLGAVAAGCTNHAFLAPPATAARYRQVVDGSLEKVSAILEVGLSEASVPVLVKRRSTEVRLAGKSRSGKVFCLSVKPEQSRKGQRCSVTVQWDRAPDDELWQTVVDILTAEAEDEKAEQPPA
jgi:hypothetical protein